MQHIRHIFLLTIIIASCDSPSKQTKDLQTPIDTLSIKKSVPTAQTNENKKADTVVIPETHLRDTIFIKGNFVLFLRPDSTRFNSYAKVDDNIYTADGDFGIGISATMDTMSTNKKYKNIKTKISKERYIVIKDCKNCPVTVDRDTIDYGLILSSKGKEIKINTFLHSGDYLFDVDEYFNVKNGRQTRIGE